MSSATRALESCDACLVGGCWWRDVADIATRLPHGQDFATAEVHGYTDNLLQSLNALFLSPVANKAMRAKAPRAESRACPFMGWLLGFSLILGRFDGVEGSDTSTGIEAGSCQCVDCHCRLVCILAVQYSQTNITHSAHSFSLSHPITTHSLAKYDRSFAMMLAFA